MRVAGDSSSDRPRGRSVLSRLTALVVLRFVVLEAVGLLSLVPTARRPLADALEMWTRWDAAHYLRIAEVGYRPRSVPSDDPLFIVFFPGYPMVVRVVAFVVRDLVVSGLLVSGLASIGAGWLLYRLVLLDGDHHEAWRAVVLLFTFPTAFFLAAPYSEAMFLFIVLAAMYAARTHHWLRSGLAGAVATATRVAGVALLPALAFAAFASEGRWTARFRRLALVAIAVGGLAAYLAINQVVHNDAFWFMHVQRSHWFQRPVPPWEPILAAVGELLAGVPDSTRRFIHVSRLAAFAFAVPLLVLASKRLRRVDAIYGWAALLIVASTSWLISLPRYLLPIYPIFVVEAKLTRSTRAFWTVVLVGIVLQLWLFWRFVRGIWAF